MVKIASKMHSAHPRPPSLSPRAFGARHIMPLFGQKKLPPKSPYKKMDTLERERNGDERGKEKLGERTKEEETERQAEQKGNRNPRKKARKRV